MVTSLLRKMILGKKEKFLFKGYQEGNINFKDIDDETGLYIHIPFCRSLCPYCPYNKILYDRDKADAYKVALIKELTLQRENLKDKKINSIYIGGGTPTLMAKELKEVIKYIKSEFNFKGDIGIEIHLKEVEEDLLMDLKELGINLISLGVQTFDNDILKFLGRNYNNHDIDKAITLIKSFNFQCLDIDIMTNLPGQTLEDIRYDLEKVYSYNIDQLSIYPLIIFPMTKMQKVIKEKNLSRLNEWQERKVLQVIDEVSKEYGYDRSSIWTYGKTHNNRYTSVTRESFVGFGAGASSHFGNYFYLNTFSVDDYINALEEDRLPINIVNFMTDREKMIFWIFWRCYDGIIDGKRFKELFQKDMQKEFKLLFFLLKFLRLAVEEEGKIILTDFGRYVYHFVEKQYSIHYLNKLWQDSMEKAWIEEVKI